jgi:hypothetical protein
MICAVNAVSILEKAVKARAGEPVRISAHETDVRCELFSRMISANVVKVWMSTKNPREIPDIRPNLPQLRGEDLFWIPGTAGIEQN